MERYKKIIGTQVLQMAIIMFAFTATIPFGCKDRFDDLLQYSALCTNSC
jgi:hypothetical protein